MEQSADVGQNIKRIRIARKMTQEDLAKKAGVSRTRLSLVENPDSDINPSHSWVAIVAAAMEVDAGVLYGAPSEAEQLDGIVPTVRRVVSSIDPLPGVDPEPLDTLRLLVDKVGRWRHAGAYSKISAMLPDLTDQLLVATQRDGTAAYELLVTVYRAGNTLSHKMGHYDLSTLATDRMVWAATNAEDPLLLATTQYVRSAALARVGETRRAILLTDKTIADIEEFADDRVGAAVLSALHMRRAGLAAAFSDGETADTHFAEARALGAKSGDGQVHGTVVGPTNVALFELSAAVDLGQLKRAHEIAENTVFPADYPKERQAHFWLDRARLSLNDGTPDRAVSDLQNAFEAAPEYFRKSRAGKSGWDAVIVKQSRVSESLRALGAAAGFNGE